MDEKIISRIISLNDPKTNSPMYTFWHREIENSGQVIYSGMYALCELPSGQRCVKAVFPLPNGNATVLLKPIVQPDGSLLLESRGSKFGQAGFYFQLLDSKGDLWANYIRSFCDRLELKVEKDPIYAHQRLSLWGLRVVDFQYQIQRNNN